MKPNLHSVDAERPSWAWLARYLEVSLPTLTAWRKTSGAPKGIDVMSWKTWVENNRKRNGGSKELRDEKTRHEILLIKSKLDREDRKVIDRDEVSRLLLHIAAQQRALLYQFMDSEAAPKLDGMSAVMMRPLLREFADSLCDRMAALVEDFEKA